MTTETLQAFVTLAVGLFGGGVLKAFWDRRKTNADAAQVLVLAAMEVVNRWREQADGLRVDIDKLHSRMSDLEDALARTSGERDVARAEVERLRRIEQEQASKITRLEERVRQLESENADLAARLEALETRANRAEE